MYIKTFLIAFIFSIVLPVASHASTVLYSPLRRIIETPITDFSFSSSTVNTTLILPNHASSTVADIIYNQYANGSIRTTCSSSISGNSNTPSYVSSNTGVGTINQSGSITYVADGNVHFNARVNTNIRQIACMFSTETNATTTSFYSLTSNSFGQYLMNNMSYIVQSTTSPGYDDETSIKIKLYSATNDSTNVYTRNSLIFASSTNFTSIPAYNSQYGADFNGILVAPDILIMANHATPSNGTTLYFVTSTSTTLTRTILSQTQIGTTDIQVVRISSPFLGASGITPAKTLPSNTFYNKISQNAGTYGNIPLIYHNQFRNIHIRNILGLFNQPHVTGLLGTVSSNVLSPFHDWSSTVITGDSGSPVMALIGNEAVAVGTWYSSSNPSTISQFATEINSAITSLGSAYSLTAVDLSAYPTY